jgi:hypothetical protein
MVTQKTPRVLRLLGVFLDFNVTYHGYFALWSSNQRHIMYATMLAITDIMKVENESTDSPPSCHQCWGGNELIVHDIAVIVNS